MQIERLPEHQIKVEALNRDGVITLIFPDGQTLIWPIADKQVNPGVVYLTLSLTSTLPDKSELAKLVLQEILKV